MYKRKAHILFLCTGNSCRSQMAEGFANAMGSDYLEAKSAGIEAHGKNPRAISIMKELDIDISSQDSTKVTDEMIHWADLIITVCGHADENCPAVANDKQKKHWPLEDPAKAQGSEEEILHEFRRIRDDIKQRVNSVIGGMKMNS